MIRRGIMVLLVVFSVLLTSASAFAQSEKKFFELPRNFINQFNSTTHNKTFYLHWQNFYADDNLKNMVLPPGPTLRERNDLHNQLKEDLDNTATYTLKSFAKDLPIWLGLKQSFKGITSVDVVKTDKPIVFGPSAKKPLDPYDEERRRIRDEQTFLEKNPQANQARILELESNLKKINQEDVSRYPFKAKFGFDTNLNDKISDATHPTFGVSPYLETSFWGLRNRLDYSLDVSGSKNDFAEWKTNREFGNDLSLNFNQQIYNGYNDGNKNISSLHLNKIFKKEALSLDLSQNYNWRNQNLTSFGASKTFSETSNVKLNYGYDWQDKSCAVTLFFEIIF